MQLAKETKKCTSNSAKLNNRSLIWNLKYHLVQEEDKEIKQWLSLSIWRNLSGIKLGSKWTNHLKHWVPEFNFQRDNQLTDWRKRPMKLPSSKINCRPCLKRVVKTICKLILKCLFMKLRFPIRSLWMYIIQKQTWQLSSSFCQKRKFKNSKTCTKICYCNIINPIKKCGQRERRLKLIWHIKISMTTLREKKFAKKKSAKLSDSIKKISRCQVLFQIALYISKNLMQKATSYGELHAWRIRSLITWDSSKKMVCKHNNSTTTWSSMKRIKD